MIIDLVATVRCDYCPKQLTTKAHFNHEGFRFDVSEGWVLFTSSGTAICPDCAVGKFTPEERSVSFKVPHGLIHVMQAGVTLCGISEVPANWPAGWKWVSVAQKELHGEVNCPGCLKGLEEP